MYFFFPLNYSSVSQAVTLNVIEEAIALCFPRDVHWAYGLIWWKWYNRLSKLCDWLLISIDPQSSLITVPTDGWFDSSSPCRHTVVNVTVTCNDVLSEPWGRLSRKMFPNTGGALIPPPLLLVLPSAHSSLSLCPLDGFFPPYSFCSLCSSLNLRC